MSYKNILVIKVGTSTLTGADTAGVQLDTPTFHRIAQQARSLQAEGFGIIIVSSAAITAGMAHANLIDRPSRITNMPELQRMASIGWRLILNQWAEAFTDRTIGELLVTKQELDNAQERTELITVVEQLLQHENICIVNENDAITHDEIAFGDNDTLAAHLAARLAQSNHTRGTVQLLILSDIEGVYEDKDNPSTLIPIIEDIAALQSIASDSATQYGTGGMTTKFLAAKIAQAAGVETAIGRGKRDGILRDLLSGKTGTRFIQRT